MILLEENLLQRGHPVASNFPLALSQLPRLAGQFIMFENEATEAENNTKFQLLMKMASDQGQLGPADVVYIDRSGEVGSWSHARMTAISEICDAIGFPLSQVVYVSQVRPPTLSDDGPRWLFFHHYFWSMAATYGSISHNFGYESAGQRVLCLNHKLRPHRLAFAAAITSLGWRDRFNLSWAGADAKYTFQEAAQEAAAKFPSLASEILTFSPPPLVKFERDPNGPAIESLPLSALADSFLELVCETEIEPWSTRLTEKSLKPIAGHRPFIIFGPQGSLKRLREFGFETFAPLFCEDYDDVALADDRLQAILETLREIWSMPRTELLRSCRDICLSNQLHLAHHLRRKLLRRLEGDLLALFGQSIDEAHTSRQTT